MASNTHVPRHAEMTATPRTRKAVSVLVASVGVAAAATALAAPADAQSAQATAVWDRVASCESGQRWNINTGNGYYGGLQFSASTWRAYHGAKYASSADEATKMQQIQVARRVLNSQGADAWPVCGPRAGLNRSNGQATGAALPDDANGATATRAIARKKVAHKKVAHKKGVHAKHAVTHYVVRRGDTLSKIAAKKHVRGGWQALYRANRGQLHNPDVLRIGQHLLIP